MTADSSDSASLFRRRTLLTAGAWLWVGLPLSYGLYELIRKATQLFTS